MVYALILACELAFWLFVLLGLAARYLLRSQRLSTAFLICVPLTDLALLALATYDVFQGRPPAFSHGLATAYIGFTIAFGPILIAWADARFAHRFNDADAPEAPPAKGWPALRYELGLWARCLVANSISSLLIAALLLLLPSGAQTSQLRAWYGINISIAIIWFLFGPLFPIIPMAFASALRLLKTPRYN